MQIVLRDGVVVAIHDDGQPLAGLYPGCEIVTAEAATACAPGDPDPRTDEEKAQVYRDRRRLEYPAIVDQLDMIYWDQINGTTWWRDAIATVKAHHPKP